MSSSGSRSSTAMTSSQYAYLSLLVVYTSSLTFLMRRSRQADPSLPHNGLYSIPVSILLAECIKLAMSLAMVSRESSQRSLFEDKRSQYTQLEVEAEEGHVDTDEKRALTASTLDGYKTAPYTRIASLREVIFARDCWKLSVPAGLYVVQNLLQILAITTVSAVTYQAVSQLKILATSLLSVWLLSRRYSHQQWISIFALVCGVIMVSLSKIKGGSPILISSDDMMLPAAMMGILCVLAAVTMGSGAAVYMEKVLKSDFKTSLWVRNGQLSVFSLIPASFAVLYEACRNGAWHPLQNFGLYTWLTVFARSAGGFLIALILKRTDAVLKGMATSFAMVLSILIESIVFEVPIALAFAVGATLVVVSSSAYVKYGGQSK